MNVNFKEFENKILENINRRSKIDGVMNAGVTHCTLHQMVFCYIAHGFLHKSTDLDCLSLSVGV